MAGACYECNFTPATYERFNRSYACPYGLRARESDHAVPTTAVTTSVTAAIQVEEGLHLIHGLPQEQRLKPGERLTIYVRPYHMVRDRLEANEQCLAHDPLPRDIFVSAQGWDMAIRDLFALISDRGGAEILELNRDLVIGFDCTECGGSERVLRPKEKVYHDEAPCPGCGAMRYANIVSTVTRESPLADYTLRELGVPAKDIIGFRLKLSETPQRIYVQLGS